MKPQLSAAVSGLHLQPAVKLQITPLQSLHYLSIVGEGQSMDQFDHLVLVSLHKQF